MGTGFNQIVTISGGPGATSVQHIDYVDATHTLTSVAANGTTTPVKLKDSHLESAFINGDKMTFSIGDSSLGLPSTVLDVDITDLKNAAFATQVETDDGTLLDVTISPAMLKAWLANEVRANQPTSANAGKLVPVDANGTIDPKWLPHISMTNVHVKPDKAALDALLTGGTLLMGDTGIDIAGNKSYIYDGHGWQELLTPTSAITSVAGQVSGNIVLNMGDIAETSARLHLAPGNTTGDVLVWSQTAGAWESQVPVSLEVGGKAFKLNTEYKLGDVISNDGKIYTPVAAFTSGATFDPTHWKEVEGVPAFDSVTAYKEDDVVIQNHKMFIANQTTIPGMFNIAEWDAVGVDTWIGLSDTPATYVANGAIPGNIVVQNSAGTGVTFTNTVDGGTFN